MGFKNSSAVFIELVQEVSIDLVAWVLIIIIFLLDCHLLVFFGQLTLDLVINLTCLVFLFLKILIYGKLAVFIFTLLDLVHGATSTSFFKLA